MVLALGLGKAIIKYKAIEEEGLFEFSIWYRYGDGRSGTANVF